MGFHSFIIPLSGFNPELCQSEAAAPEAPEQRLSAASWTEEGAPLHGSSSIYTPP